VRRIFIGLVVVVMTATMAHAFEAKWTLGYWSMTQTDDPTDRSKRTVAYLKDGAALFAIRCINRNADFALTEGTSAGFRIGETIPLTFWGDNYTPLTIAGFADSGQMVEFKASEALWQEIVASKTYAIRYVQAGKVQVTHIWQAGNIMSVLSWMQDCK
jgi:hypothetical protein